MDEFQSEKEQIEEIKAWWAEYGRYVIAGVVIAVGLLVGFNRYEASKINAQTEASALFEALADNIVDGDLEDAISVASELSSNYANTAYAAQSRLAMARLYMDKNRDQDAVDMLNELLAMRGNGALKHVGRVRLARIYLYQDKPQEVLDLLAGQDNAAFAGLYAEARGDAHAALGQIEEAREAYAIALADTTQSVNRGFVQMKLLDLPDVVAAVAPDAAAAEEPGAESTMDSPVEDTAVTTDDVTAGDEAGETE
ncbi:MAG: tetratricopeptide repeat protein [Woeseiaceae bacterium]|nr:tetratricopeptide repeat protein [Woeseiaceae bacterium]NIP21978.1 tetratricopeptide repeat protein [Woeseiaceae bacterium]NIS91102.1 tetratricopeptide repeat protein [Woeseiaceae bacterium]